MQSRSCGLYPTWRLVRTPFQNRTRWYDEARSLVVVTMPIVTSPGSDCSSTSGVQSSTFRTKNEVSDVAKSLKLWSNVTRSIMFKLSVASVLYPGNSNFSWVRLFLSTLNFELDSLFMQPESLHQDWNGGSLVLLR